MGDYAFSGCTSLRTVVLNSGLEVIDSYAFSGCSVLESGVSIPDSVTKVGTYAFNNSGYWKNAATDLVYVDKWLVGCKNKEITDVVVTDGTVGISDYSFYQCKKLQYATMPESLEIIGRSAFYSCNMLREINIPQSVRSIGDYAFYRTWSLMFADIPKGITKIGRSAFYECGMALIIIPDSVTEIDDYAFYGCTTAISLEIGKGVKTIGDRAFQGCVGLETVKIPDNVESIGAHAFDKCYFKNTEGEEFGVKKVIVGSGVKQISNYAFANCNLLESVTLSSGVTEIGNYAFYKAAALKEIEIGDSVEKIGDFAFFGCETLTEVVIPENVKEIGRYAFRNCKSLTAVALGESLETIGSHAFYGCPDLTIYAAPEKRPDGWNNRFNSSYRPEIWGCTLSEDNGYVVSFVKTETSIVNSQALGGIKAPVRNGYVFLGWATSAGGDVVYAAADVAQAPNGAVLYACWEAVPESPESDE